MWYHHWEWVVTSSSSFIQIMNGCNEWGMLKCQRAHQVLWGHLLASEALMWLKTLRKMNSNVPPCCFHLSPIQTLPMIEEVVESTTQSLRGFEVIIYVSLGICWTCVCVRARSRAYVCVFGQSKFAIYSRVHDKIIKED